MRFVGLAASVAALAALPTSSTVSAAPEPTPVPRLSAMSLNLAEILNRSTVEIIVAQATVEQNFGLETEAESGNIDELSANRGGYGTSPAKPLTLLPADPRYLEWQKHANKALNAEAAQVVRVHPVEALNPDKLLVLCLANCRQNVDEIVFQVSKAQLKSAGRMAQAPRAATHASTDAAQASAQVAAAAAVPAAAPAFVPSVAPPAQDAQAAAAATPAAPETPVAPAQPAAPVAPAAALVPAPAPAAQELECLAGCYREAAVRPTRRAESTEPKQPRMAATSLRVARIADARPMRHRPVQRFSSRIARAIASAR